MRYLKFVLTVIAVCQLYAVAKDMTGQAHAAGVLDVNIVSVGRVMAPGFVPVRVQP